MAKTIEEQWAAVKLASTVLAAVPGARIVVGWSLTEPAVEALASCLRVTVRRQVSLYKHDFIDTGRKPLAIFRFEGKQDGVVICGQGSRVATEAEIRTCTLHHSPESPVATVDEALERLSEKRDEFSCPCCGTPTDSSYCDACTKAECGEQHVDAPHNCLAGKEA